MRSGGLEKTEIGLNLNFSNHYGKPNEKTVGVERLVPDNKDLRNYPIRPFRPPLLNIFSKTFESERARVKSAKFHFEASGRAERYTAYRSAVGTVP